MADTKLDWTRRDDMAWELYRQKIGASTDLLLTVDVQRVMASKSDTLVSNCYMVVDCFLDRRQTQLTEGEGYRMLKVKGEDLQVGDELFTSGDFRKIVEMGIPRLSGFDVIVEILDPEAKDPDNRRWLKKIATSASAGHIVRRPYKLPDGMR